ncbi:hypothetical protein L1887_13797 [Cichorium endivia]|nr:hypothetical protein L1887_13797 [Cichorium endivia]
MAVQRLREVIGRRTRKGEKDSVVKALVEEPVVDCICVLGREKQKSGVWCVGGVILEENGGGDDSRQNLLTIDTPKKTPFNGEHAPKKPLLRVVSIILFIFSSRVVSFPTVRHQEWSPDQHRTATAPLNDHWTENLPSFLLTAAMAE